MLRSKGIEMAIDRITPHDCKFAAVLSPAAFLQGWTLVFAMRSWMGVYRDATCATERLGAQPSVLSRRLLGTLKQGFSCGRSEIPLQHREAMCTCIQVLVFLASLGRKAWIRYKANLTTG